MEEYTPDLITIIDEEGNEHLFEELDRVETETGKYVALLPFYENLDENEDEEDELIILKVTEENDEVILEPIEDEKEFDEVGEIFEERLAELFDFDEE